MDTAEINIVCTVQNLSKVKTKRRPPSATNKRTASQANFDNSTCREQPSRFKYVKAETAGTKVCNTRKKPWRLCAGQKKHEQGGQACEQGEQACEQSRQACEQGGQGGQNAQNRQGAQGNKQVAQGRQRA